MAIIIKVNGQKQEDVKPSNGKTFSLAELQDDVGGYIQIVPIITGEHSGKLMIVDEEGLLKTNPQVNTEASIIAGRRIVGQVVVINRDESE